MLRAPDFERGFSKPLKRTPERILIVDDSKTNRLIIMKFLKTEGYLCEEASNGKNALLKLKENKYDLLLLDLEMPEMDGFELLRYLKSNSKFKDIPIIIITALEDLKSAVSCISMGADDYLPRTFEPALLRARIKALLEKNRLIKREKEHLKYLKKELLLAKQLQQKLIPSKLPEIKGFSFETIYEPMEAVGGDFYDFMLMPNKTGIFISDVCGHGLTAAFITSMVKMLLETAQQNNLAPNDLLKYLNDNLILILEEKFLTAFYGILDHESLRFTYSRAAHDFPVLIRDETVHYLKGKGALLGVFKEIELDLCEIQLQKGDKLIFYTDGLVEAFDDNKNQFLNQFLKISKKGSHTDLHTLVQTIHRAFSKHIEFDDVKDDVCIVGLEVLV